MRFALILFFYTDKRPPRQLVWSASRIQTFLLWQQHGHATSLKISGNLLNRKGGGMSDDVMELFYFKQFRIVRTSKGLSIRDILPWKHILYFQMSSFYAVWLKRYVILILQKMSILLELRFHINVNIYNVSSFKDFQNVVFVSKSFFS